MICNANFNICLVWARTWVSWLHLSIMYVLQRETMGDTLLFYNQADSFQNLWIFPLFQLLKLHSLFTVWVVLASRTFLPIQKRSLGVLISEVHKVNNKLINTFKETHIFLEEEHCISLTEFCWWLIFLVVNLCNWIGSF